MQKHQSFLLGFGCCFLIFLLILCFLIEIGRPERGSGRRPVEEIYAKLLNHVTYVGQHKPDRDPPKGNGRKDAN